MRRIRRNHKTDINIGKPVEGKRRQSQVAVVDSSRKQRQATSNSSILSQIPTTVTRRRQPEEYRSQHGIKDDNDGRGVTLREQDENEDVSKDRDVNEDDKRQKSRIRQDDSKVIDAREKKKFLLKELKRQTQKFQVGRIFQPHPPPLTSLTQLGMRTHYKISYLIPCKFRRQQKPPWQT